jgi:hypothetical protein
MVTTIKRGSSREKIHKIMMDWTSRRRKIDLERFCGIIRIKDDPITLQKAWRNEWE